MNALDVLLVDDDPVVLRTLTRALGPRYRVRTAASALDARREIGHRAPDAIVSDFNLPDGNGGQVLEMVARSHPRTLRVLYASGGSPAYDTFVGKGLAQQVVAKPAPAQEVLRVLERMANRTV